MNHEYRKFNECGPRGKNKDTPGGGVKMPQQERTLFILSHGMGGHRRKGWRAGKVASL